jgi:hypothetical protein
MAQAPVRIDLKHYTIEFENEQVRVLRIRYGPHEKSVMHGHPASLAVSLTDAHGTCTLPDGKTEDRMPESRRWRLSRGRIRPCIDCQSR